MSKQMALSFLPPFYLAAILKGANRRKIKNAFVVTLVPAALIGWYYARNWVLFRDLFAIKVQKEVLAPNLVQEKSISELS